MIPAEEEKPYFLSSQLSIESIQPPSPSSSSSSSSSIKLVPEFGNHIQQSDIMLKQNQPPLSSLSSVWITSTKRFHPPTASSSSVSGSSKFSSPVAPSIRHSRPSSHFKLIDSLQSQNRHHHPHLRDGNKIVPKLLLFLMSMFLLRQTTTTIRLSSLSLLVMVAKCDQLSTNNGGGSSASSSNTIPSALPLVNFRCPDQFGYYADEYNCSKYYVCVFGEALHESCTGGLRFSSELQTCDWPRNVVCPFEDSDYADETEDEYPNDPNDLTRSKHSHRHNQQVNQHNHDQHQPQQVGSGMIIETTTSRTTINPPIMITSTTAKPLMVGGGGGYVGDNPFVAIHKPPTQTQNDPLVYRTHNSNNKAHEEEHAAILIHDSFDKLLKPNLGRQPTLVQQPKTSIQPANHYDPIQPNQVLVPNNFLDEALMDFAGGNHSTILNYNQQRANNRNRGGHQRNHPRQHHIQHQHPNPPPNHVDDDGASIGDLDENFTLVDLQRSRTGTSAPSGGNILGTIGRSVNGENNNRAQSVSVVASTSSKAIIPELDFVFKNHNPSIGDKQPPPLLAPTHQSSGEHLEQNPNQLLIDEILQLTQALNQENSKFDDVITAIVDENGAIHLAGGTDSPALLRLLAASGPSKPPSVSSNSNQPPQEGLAASTRNLASQQLITVNGGNRIDNNNGNFSADKYKYKTTTSHQGGGGGGLTKSQPQPPPLDPEIEFKTLEPGAILVYNKTRLIVVPENKPSSLATNHYNSSAVAFGTISSSHNVSSGSGRPSLEYLTDFASTSVDSNSNKPRQLNTRTDKESSYLYNQADLHNQKSNINNRSSTPSIHSRINPKQQQQQQQPSPTPTNAFSTISTLSLDGSVDDDIEDLDDGFSLMMKPGAIGGGMMKDFQRIGPPPRPSSGGVNNRTQAHDSDVHKRRIPEYRQTPSLARSNQTLTINTTQQHSSGGSSSNHIRASQVRHLGSHHRNTQSKSAAIANAPSGSTNSTSPSQTSRVGKNLQMPQRPPAMYKTPEPLSTATKCSEQACKLPDCFCGGTDVPGGLPVKDVPQLVLISFDDAVNDINWHIYEELLNSGRSNPNGCPIKSTFYVSHEWTDYSQVQTLYSRGHEIASHSITHSFGESYDKQQWYKEIVGQREILHLYGGVNKVDIRGMRAPFLQGGGNKQFEMLHEENFTYDSSMPVFENSPPFWPYTLDYSINHECMIAPCPTESFPGLWEIGLVMWQDLHGGRCSMGDACSNPSDEKGVYELIMKNFKRHYNSNRAPFGLYYHSAWFNSEHHRKGFIRVIDDLLTYYKDVYFVTKWELIQWIRNPTPLKELYRVNLFGCARDPHRPPPCLHPNICNVGSNSGARFLKTCQPCPKRYPWLDDTGQ